MTASAKSVTVMRIVENARADGNFGEERRGHREVAGRDDDRDARDGERVHDTRTREEPSHALAMKHHQVGADHAGEQRAVARVEILILDREAIDPGLHVRQIEEGRHETVPDDDDPPDDAGEHHQAARGCASACPTRMTIRMKPGRIR